MGEKVYSVFQKPWTPGSSGLLGFKIPCQKNFNLENDLIFQPPLWDKKQILYAPGIPIAWMLYFVYLRFIEVEAYTNTSTLDQAQSIRIILLNLT